MSETHVSTEAAAPRPEVTARPSEWTGRRIAAVVIGSLLVLVSLALLGGGGTALWADLTQREAGYVTTDTHDFSTSGSALVTEPTHLGSAGVEWLYAPALLGKVRIRVTPTNARSNTFVGIGRSADVDRYLAGVSRTVISGFFEDKAEAVSGEALGSPPAAQHFWVTSTAGPGTQSLRWKPKDGSWSVVVMNADGRTGVDVKTDFGARMGALLWIALGLLAAGAVFIAGGALLIGGAIRSRGAER